ncbi:MAG: sugar phosphate isomerase/epimerase [Defluviitaleaceae bacterium]|nr:sugar phosphate isomerase/epimerase [Defluviitaleaceae bacterium]MCL2836564.1 sugar phosphate isomerase/epimerase [Defluviitaleaceae bacterium]
MSKQFKLGIVVDVVPLNLISKGWEYFEVPAAIHASALFSDKEWEDQKALYKADGRPCLSTSHMLGPGMTWRGACGPYYNREVILFALEREFKRLNELGCKYIGCWGGHFYCPDGFDRAKAMDQAISTANIMADFAEMYGMEIALEPQAELATLWPRYLEAIDFAKMTGRRSIKAMVDLNYFLELDQPLEDILKYPEYCLDVHIQGDGGAQPNVGSRDDIFLKLFKILKEIGYDKGVSAACPWVITNGAAEIDYKYETDTTLAYLQGLREKVYK